MTAARTRAAEPRERFGPPLKHGKQGIPKGAHVGGIATLEDLRGRCVITAGDRCWHLRTARGREHPKGQVIRIWGWGVGLISANRLAWRLAGNAEVPKGSVVYRTCDSHDCVNPGHLRCGTKGQEIRAKFAAGCFDTAAKVRQWRDAVAKTRKVEPEQVRWALESQQSSVDVSHALGVSTSRIIAIRAKARRSLAGLQNAGWMR